MNDTVIRHRIVVGVDGSAASGAALQWAVQEARLRDATVHLVRAYDSDTRLRAPYAPWSPVPHRADRGAVQAELSVTADLVRPYLAPGQLIAELVHDLPVRALLDRSAGADLLVLGTNRPGHRPGEPPPPMGPVARTCLRAADCPVVVVGPGSHPARQAHAEPDFSPRPEALFADRSEVLG